MHKAKHDMTVISENFSDNKKPKRGRPKAFPEEHEAMLDAVGIFMDTHSRRGQVNKMYRQVAVSVLSDCRELSWLLDPEAMERGGTKGAWKPTIMAELGRIENPDEMRKIARQICVIKPKVKEAIVLIRRYRVGQNKPKKEQLENEICNLLEDYRVRYPQTSHQTFISALDFGKEVIDSIFGYAQS